VLKLKALLIVLLAAMLIAAGAVLAGQTGNSAAQIDWSSAQRVDLEMVDYEFVPKEVRLRRGLPYRLHLVNAGGDAHDFTAADFFASVQLRDDDANERRTSVFLEPGQTTDIYFMARKAASFAARCADHDWAGMTATIIID
jgi:uncharacterized cupredoxin-like copper-binding protein